MQEKDAGECPEKGTEMMLWIIGSLALVLFGTVLMCILIVGGRADDRIESTKLIEPSICLSFRAETLRHDPDFVFDMAEFD